MKLNPPLKRNGVDVIDINLTGSSLKCIVHVASNDHNFSVHESKAAIDCSIQETLDYLDKEGFIPSVHGWHAQATVVVHPSGGEDNNCINA